MATQHSTDRLLAVAIVGRPNVGKSPLFNRLAGRRIAIVHDQPGVTRDRIHARCRLGTRPFDIIDTGGIGGGSLDEMSDAVRQEAEIGIEVAGVIVLVVDAQEGVTPVDEELAKRLRRARKPVLVVANKIDHDLHELSQDEFSALGLGRPLPVSAAHGRGISELVSAIEGRLGPVGEGEASVVESGGGVRPVRLAIVGRPNVGKSSLVNALLRERRTIVSEVPGTTRDSVDIEFRHGSRDYVVIDTAGMRHRRRHRTSVEVFSSMRAERAVGRADLCVLLIDLSMGVTSQDRQIGQLIQEANRPCILVGSKWDLVKPEGGREDGYVDGVIDGLRSEMFFLGYAPIVLLSALEGEHVQRLMPQVERVLGATRRKIGTGRLNRLLHETVEKRPPPLRSGRRFKLLYATQAESGAGTLSPPRFVLFVNDPALMAPEYLRFLAGQIRTLEEYPGSPLLFEMRGRPQGDSPKGRVAHLSA
jgi:GTPase